MYVICHFPLVSLNIYFIFVFSFCQFDYYVSQCVPPWAYTSWDSLCFLDLVDYFLSQLGKFTAIISANIFSDPFSFYSSGTSPI